MLPERVMWTQGMHVSPVHMQQQDRYADIQLRRREAMLCPYSWGFTSFAIDEQYLGLGKILLSKAEGIMPDGTLFDASQGQNPLALDIEPGLTDRVVALALPMSVPDTLETRDMGTLGLSTRYIRTPVLIRDHNAYKERNSGDASILCGRLDLRLMLEEESALKGYVTMPVARIVESRQDKNILLDKEFQPTFLHLEASPTLHRYLRELVGLIAHRADHLANRVSNAGQTGTAELGDFMLLQCLNRMEPVFRHLDSIPGLHPEEFYRLALSLVGELASFSERAKRPQHIDAYNHALQ